MGKPTLRVTKSGEDAFDIEVKRFYIPGSKIEDVCPKCQAPTSRDCDDDYFSFPVANAPFSETLCCGECGAEWEVQLIIRISLEVVATKGSAE